MASEGSGGYFRRKPATSYIDASGREIRFDSEIACGRASRVWKALEAIDMPANDSRLCSRILPSTKDIPPSPPSAYLTRPSPRCDGSTSWREWLQDWVETTTPSDLRTAREDIGRHYFGSRTHAEECELAGDALLNSTSSSSVSTSHQDSKGEQVPPALSMTSGAPSPTEAKWDIEHRGREPPPFASCNGMVEDREEPMEPRH